MVVTVTPSVHFEACFTVIIKNATVRSGVGIGSIIRSYCGPKSSCFMIIGSFSVVTEKKGKFDGSSVDRIN